MSKVTKETLQKAHKPFDVISIESGEVGIIQEVSVNEFQEGFDDQVSYAIEWLTGKETKLAWFNHDELRVHCNLFIKIAEMTCHPMGSNSGFVERLFNEN